MDNRQLSVVELFAGTGGLGLGFHLEGFKTVVAYEYEDDCINTYNKNFPDTRVIKKDLSAFNDNDIDDLKKILKQKTGKETVDIVTGGPPCRSFSTANPKKKEKDTRDFMFRTLIKVANALEAKYFVMENVVDFNSKDSYETHDKKIFHVLLEDLYNAGFKYINFEILNAADFGTPQTRERLIILGTKCETLPLTFPKAIYFKDKAPYWITVEDALEDLPDVTAPKDDIKGIHQNLLIHEKRSMFCNRYPSKPRNEFTKYCRNKDNVFGYHKFPWLKHKDNELENFILPDHGHRIIERYSLLKEDENQGSLVERLQKELSKDEIDDLYIRKVLPEKVFIQKNRKLPLSKPSRTVTSHVREELVHPKHNRNLTAREAARLQSFPDWYVFSGINQKPYKGSEFDIGNGRDFYQQAGDAVPPLLSAALAKELKNNLLNNYQEAKCSTLRDEIINWVINSGINVYEAKRIKLSEGVAVNQALTGKEPLDEVIVQCKIGSNQ